MQVLTLKQFGEERFLHELESLSNENFIGDKRNKDWFTRLPEIYKTRFVEWFFLVEDNNLIAFSTIQEFYSKCFRVLTRTYYSPNFRRRHMAYEHNKKTPAMHMLNSQLEYIESYETLFISMQDIKRRKVLVNLKNKLGNNWKLHPQMIQTCNEINDKNCWQNIIYTGVKPKLPSISIDKWHSL